jgi:hypothetical protein
MGHQRERRIKERNDEARQLFCAFSSNLVYDYILCSKPSDVYWEVFGNEMVVFKHNRNVDFEFYGQKLSGHSRNFSKMKQ